MLSYTHCGPFGKHEVFSRRVNGSSLSFQMGDLSGARSRRQATARVRSRQAIVPAPRRSLFLPVICAHSVLAQEMLIQMGGM